MSLYARVYTHTGFIIVHWHMHMIMYTENAFAYEYAYTIQVQIHICMNMHMHIYKCPSPSSYIVLTFAFPSKYDFVMMASCPLYEFNMCPSVNLSSIFSQECDIKYENYDVFTM